MWHDIPFCVLRDAKRSDTRWASQFCGVTRHTVDTRFDPVSASRPLLPKRLCPKLTVTVIASFPAGAADPIGSEPAASQRPQLPAKFPGSLPQTVRIYMSLYVQTSVPVADSIVPQHWLRPGVTCQSSMGLSEGVAALARCNTMADCKWRQ